MRPIDASKPLSATRKTGYGIGICGISFAWMMTAITLMNFYTEVLGLSAQDVGAEQFIGSGAGKRLHIM